MILSVDPGKVNFAWSILDYKGNIIKYGMIDNTIIDFINFESQVKNFYNEVKQLKRYKVEVVIYERFMPRGNFFRGNLVELVNTMVGIFISCVKPKHINTLTAASWKNFRTKNDLFVKSKVEEHLSDAITMGLYYLHKDKYISLNRFRTAIKIIKTLPKYRTKK